MTARRADETTVKGRRVTLGVTGGIAAYKSAHLCRLLVRDGAEVRVVMTEAATRFVTPLTMEALSGRPVPVEMFAGTSGPIEHISLADWSEILVIAPATADYLARCAAGRASDLLSALTLAFTGPVLAAPSMNANMWSNPATRRNVEILSREHGWRFASPGVGDLACGWTGPGRLAEPEEIAEAIRLSLRRDLDGRRVLVTAGPTAEDLDPVRFLSNRSTGRMGYAVAAEAARRGAQVTLVSGPTSLPTPPGVERIDVRSALDMEGAVAERAGDCDAVVMAAAVADYRPAERSPDKIKKEGAGEERTLSLVRNPDILAGLGGRYGGSGPILVGFALETRDLIPAAERKLRDKKAHILVANSAEDALGGAGTRAVILDDAGRREETGEVGKDALAARLIDLLIERWS